MSRVGSGSDFFWLYRSPADSRSTRVFWPRKTDWILIIDWVLSGLLAIAPSECVCWGGLGNGVPRCRTGIQLGLLCAGCGRAMGLGILLRRSECSG